MNLFEDLVSDLQKENLLDDGIYTGDYSFSPKLSKVETFSNSVFKEISTLYDNSAVKLSKVKEVLPEKPAPSDFSNEVFYSPPISSDTELPLALVKPRKVRKIKIEPKRKGRYCKNCMISVPFYRLRCRFCDQMVSGGFVYLLFILLSIFTLLAVFFFIIANKTYN